MIQEISFQDRLLPTTAYLGTRDAWIAQNAPTTRYGAATRVRFDGDEPDGSLKDAYGLLAWDITAIPPGSVVTGARIVVQVTDAGSKPFELYPLLRAWSESEVTWNRASASSPWGTTGARGVSDRSPTIIGVAAPAVTGPYTLELNAEGVALVQRWVNDAAQNHGLVIADSTNANGVNVVSGESSTASQHPRLTVTYHAP